MLKITFRYSIVFVCMGLMLGSCTSDSSHNRTNKKIQPVSHHIEIKNMKFNPSTLTVNKGDTLIFTNDGIVTHDVTEKSKAWTSSPLPTGASWSKVADESFDYFCSIHVVMKGKVIVN